MTPTSIESPSAGVLAYPLLDSGPDDWEQQVLSDLQDIALRDPALARRLAAFPWVADGITWEEMRVITSASIMVDFHPSLARTLFEFAWVVDDIVFHEFQLVDMVWVIATVRPDASQLLISQPWFRDAPTEEDAAVALVLDTACNYESFCRQLIENPRVQSRTLTLPMGEAELHIVSRTALGAEAEQVFQESQTAMNALEEFFQLAWKPTDFTVYLEPEFQYVADSAGLYAGSYVMLADPGSTRTIYHEMAHKYSYHGPHWLVEGGANYLTTYI